MCHSCFTKDVHAARRHRISHAGAAHISRALIFWCDAAVFPSIPHTYVYNVLYRSILHDKRFCHLCVQCECSSLSTFVLKKYVMLTRAV